MHYKSNIYMLTRKSYIGVPKRCEKWNRIFLIVIIASLFIATYAQHILFSGQNMLFLLLQKAVPYSFVFSVLFALSASALIFNQYRYMPKKYYGMRLLLLALIIFEITSLIVRRFIDPFGSYHEVIPITCSLFNLVILAMAICWWVKFTGRLRIFGIFVLITLSYNFLGTFFYYFFHFDNVLLYNVLFSVISFILRIGQFVLLERTMVTRKSFEDS